MLFLFGNESKGDGHVLHGILGIATGVFRGGDSQRWSIIEQISKDYKLGKNQTFKVGRFTGQDIAL